MTREEREEAIYQLNRCIHNAKVAGRRYNYYEMAIQALEQEHCEDIVSRELVRKEFCNWVMCKKTPNDFLYILGGLPPVQPMRKCGKLTEEEALQKLEFERNWLADAGYNAYNVDIAFDAIRTIIKVLCGDEHCEESEVEE